LLDKFSPNAIRWEILSHHYRKQWEFKEEDMPFCDKNLEDLEKLIRQNHHEEKTLDQDFLNALNDDLNTSLALEILVEKKPKSLKSCLSLLGFAL
jgi:cysteinyl-tRNA synthetase